jgi:hypothetical protein
MSKYAPNVFSDPVDVARLEALVGQLPGNARVSIVEFDGTTSTGVVAVVPSMQTFRDAAEQEGLNGVVRIQDDDLPDGFRVIWLDSIKRVIQHDSVLGSPAS